MATFKRPIFARSTDFIMLRRQLPQRQSDVRKSVVVPTVHCDTLSQEIPLAGE